MIDAEAMGRLPMRLESWTDELQLGWRNETDPDDPIDVIDTGGKGKAVESSSTAKLDDPVHLDKSEKGRAAHKAARSQDVAEKLTLIAILKGEKVELPKEDLAAEARKETMP